MRAFLERIADLVPEDERVLVSSVPGDPQDSAGEMWNVRPWRYGDAEPHPNMNNYVCVSSFRRGINGWRRTADLFGRMLAFMIDDVGTKVPREIVSVAPPTAIVRTSPNNDQYWYFLSQPITDYETVSRLISAFVQQRLGGVDPGMGGANRIGRLPRGINGKAQYRSTAGEPFRCEMRTFHPERRFTLGELVEMFALNLAPPRARVSPNTIPAERIAQRAEEFRELREDLERFGLVLKRHANHAGRIPILCPWFRQHSGNSRTGTYIVEPNERNNWAGSFVCFHATTHQNNNHLKDIRTWLNEVAAITYAMQCQAANADPPPFHALHHPANDA